MKKIIAVLAVFLATPAMSHDFVKKTKVRHMSGPQIVVACYRGPWNEVIWDRALPEFYDSLRAAGFSPGTADAIGNRICRDERLVGRPEVMRREAMRLISATPRN